LDNDNNFLFRFVLECRAKGSPEPEFRWFKDDVILTEDQLPEGLAIAGDRKDVLEFNRPNSDLHHGHYHCEASNK
jgi:hypothetical protein